MGNRYDYPCRFCDVCFDRLGSVFAHLRNDHRPELERCGVQLPHRLWSEVDGKCVFHCPYCCTVMISDDVGMKVELDHLDVCHLFLAASARQVS